MLDPMSTLAHAPRADGTGTARGRPLSKAHRRVQLYLLLAAIDLLALLIGYAAAADVRLAPHKATQLASVLVVLAPMYLAISFQLGGYSIRALGRWTRGVRSALTALALAALAIVAIAFAWKVGADYSRLFFGLGTGIAGVLIVGGRYMVACYGHRTLPHGPLEVVVLSDRPDAATDRRHRRIDLRAFKVAADLNCPDSLDRLGRAISHADRVVIDCAPAARQRWVTALKGSGIDIEILMPEFEALGVLDIGEQDGRMTACVARGQLSLRARTVKRAFDVAAVVWLAPLLIAALLIVSLLIKLDDGGPIFFVQRRIGRGNRFFDVYKFRTMRVATLDAAGAQSASRDDARVTRIGAFLRRTSIDELPQLLNVLMGSMSIVGPRPHALGSTAEDALFWAVDPRYWLRHATKPGLTGLAQVRGFRGATDSRAALIGRIQADLEYLSGWTLWRDMRILLATVKVVAHPNAY
ncbi:exopolysaccharide biosynthesis polyprenyl glycosylphosphotransferase [Sphingomonas zeicaulis]|uniref:exopolysaccharide biosynthesis polyprenyl glycosylphosphotransferase n=1 Tax=Sphingomonas zeicaulis TaxID=1632740 RepID=UPI003D1DCFCD